MDLRSAMGDPTPTRRRVCENTGLGICSWGGVLEGAVEEIGEGRKGVDLRAPGIGLLRLALAVGKKDRFAVKRNLRRQKRS